MIFLKVDKKLIQLTPDNEPEVKEYLNRFNKDKEIEICHFEYSEKIKIGDLFDYEK
jgi:hypothetical protein